MDRKFYTDSFERLLREKSDEFRMYPTRKIWHSIYNNIYPGRRWPSSIVGIVLLTVFPLIGFLNTKTISAPTEKSVVANNIITTKASSLFSKDAIGGTTNAELAEVPRTIFIKPSIILNSKKSNNTIQHVAPLQGLGELQANNVSAKNDIALIDKDYTQSNFSSESISEKNIQTNIITNNVDKAIAAENYALLDAQSTQKQTAKLALQIYASPSIVYGILSGPQTNLQSAEGLDNNNINQNIGLEAGTAMQYSLSNIIKVKAGLQFNYASYDVSAYQNSASAPLILNDATNGNADMLNRAADYSTANGLSSVTLHNEMYQLSLPVGLEFKLLKSNNLQWSAGATIQPTYIAGGNAYLLSSDSHSYIDESSLVNRWNLNAGFETFITYKLDGVTWQLGPQFRYQFSSTYGKAYSGVDEKVAVFGVKIGVVKLLH